LFVSVQASAVDRRIGAQQLWWQAQCERKLGRTQDALLHFAQSLEQTAGPARDANADIAELSLAMNAYHGVGTTLIALPDTSDARLIANALQTAARECHALNTPTPMRVAERCLLEAVALRRRMGQTPNQVSGSNENLSFAYLRETDFTRAFNHATAVHETGLFAWTELVRVLAANNLTQKTDATRAAAREARRNISFFNVGDFNLCELRRLLSEALYQRAVRIIQEEHPRERVACQTEANAATAPSR
jgi:hypothetical protein